MEIKTICTVWIAYEDYDGGEIIAVTRTFEDLIDILCENRFELSSHEGEEFIYVLAGALEINYGKKTYRVETGDSIYYDSIVPHHVHAADGKDAKILAVIYAPH